MKTNAERQADHKNRMREKGFVPVHIWIQADRKEILEDFAKVLRESSPK